LIGNANEHAGQKAQLHIELLLLDVLRGLKYRVSPAVKNRTLASRW